MKNRKKFIKLILQLVEKRPCNKIYHFYYIQDDFYVGKINSLEKSQLDNKL